MRQPPGGVPDVDISAGTMFVARPNTRHMWRWSWFLEETTPRHPSHWLERTRSSPSTVHIPRKRRTPSHGRDSRRRHAVGREPGYEDRVQQLLDRYTVKTVESGTFRFCGREVVQHSDFSISVRCKDTTEKIKPVHYDPKMRKQRDLARDHEIAQLRSVVGSLAWVARQCRPQLSYGVNKLQGECRKKDILPFPLSAYSTAAEISLMLEAGRAQLAQAEGSGPTLGKYIQETGLEA